MRIQDLDVMYVQDLICLDEQREDRGGQGVSESVCTTHSHDLTALSLSARGTMVATASTKVCPHWCVLTCL